MVTDTFFFLWFFLARLVLGKQGCLINTRSKLTVVLVKVRNSTLTIIEDRLLKSFLLSS